MPQLDDPLLAFTDRFIASTDPNQAEDSLLTFADRFIQDTLPLEVV